MGEEEETDEDQSQRSPVERTQAAHDGGHGGVADVAERGQDGGADELDEQLRQAHLQDTSEKGEEARRPRGRVYVPVFTLQACRESGSGDASKKNEQNGVQSGGGVFNAPGRERIANYRYSY
jgi:hypothetical protein